MPRLYLASLLFVVIILILFAGIDHVTITSTPIALARLASLIIKGFVIFFAIKLRLLVEELVQFVAHPDGSLDGFGVGLKQQHEQCLETEEQGSATAARERPAQGCRKRNKVLSSRGAQEELKEAVRGATTCLFCLPQAQSR